MDKLNPAVREGIRRSFAELDIQDPDFEEKAESMIEQFLEMQFKDVIKEWKKTDSKSFFRIEPKNRIEVFDKITEEILTELKSVMMQSSEDKALIEDKVSSMERDIKEYNQPIKRILKQQFRRSYYHEYLTYKIDQARGERDKYKEEIVRKIKEITENKEKIAEVEEEISKLRKQILEEEESPRIGTEYLENLKETEQMSIELLEMLREKEKLATEQIRLMQMIYDNDYRAKVESIREELTEEAEYFGIPIPERNTETLEDRQIPEEAGISEEGNLPEKTEELKTNPLFQQIQDITERAIQAQTPKELFEVSGELGSIYLKRRNNPEQNNEMDKIMSKIPNSREMLEIGVFYRRARKRYIELTGKENPTEEDKKIIEEIRRDKDIVETFLQERFPDQEVNILPLRTEQEYAEELKKIEQELIDKESMEVQRNFRFWKKENDKQDEDEQSITYRMRQMHSELIQVIDVTKTNNIQSIYNRIIRRLRRIPDIDYNKIPAPLKEMVVPRVETPLYRYPDSITDDGDGKYPRSDEDRAPTEL